MDKKQMSVKEKMLKEQNYKQTPEMFITLAKEKSIQDNYNKMYCKDKEERTNVLKTLLKHFGDHSDILPPVFVDYGENITIGNHSFLNHNCTILAENLVTIGDYVRIGPGCGIFTVSHSFDPEERKEGVCFARPITIEDNVWIGGNVSIAPGVTIGANSVIGMGSVVTKDIPANVVAAGNPCRVIRKTEE